MRDIALAAGVSGATVSNVLRNRGGVGAETSARVREVAQCLGYQPNPIAQALANGRAPTIAMVFSDLANPFYSMFAREAEHAARRRDHFLLVCHAAQPDGTLDTAYLGAIAGRLSGGVLILGSDLGRADLLSALPQGVPTVLSMWEDAHDFPSVPCVTLDFHEAGRMVADHLVALGHRRVAVVAGGRRGRVVHGARLAGALARLREAGLPDRPVVVEEDSIGGGYRAAARLFDREPRPTAVLATNDLLAIGVIQAAAERGLPVPGQVSVAGITDIWLSAEMRPALTTVSIDTRRVAESSVNLLLDLIAAPSIPPPEALRVVGRPRLVGRASTAQAP